MICPENQEALRAFVGRVIAALQAAGATIAAHEIEAEILPAPHRPPRLRLGKRAIYWFSLFGRCLKAGKAGPQSAARYSSQHYSPGSSGSNLARSLLNQRDMVVDLLPEAQRRSLLETTERTIGSWIQMNTTRCNLLVDAKVTERIMSLMEAVVHERLDPMFEGRRSRCPSPLIEASVIQRPEVPLPSEPVRAGDPETGVDIHNLYGHLSRFCQALWKHRQKEATPGDFASLISGLQRQNVIPQFEAGMMHTIRTVRNAHVHDHRRVGRRETEIVRSAWEVVKQWAERQHAGLWRKTSSLP